MKAVNTAVVTSFGLALLSVVAGAGTNVQAPTTNADTLPAVTSALVSTSTVVQKPTPSSTVRFDSTKGRSVITRDVLWRATRRPLSASLRPVTDSENSVRFSEGSTNLSVIMIEAVMTKEKRCYFTWPNGMRQEVLEADYNLITKPRSLHLIETR